VQVVRFSLPGLRQRAGDRHDAILQSLLTGGEEPRIRARFIRSKWLAHPRRVILLDLVAWRECNETQRREA
jgi:hypothetical protein